MSPGSPLKWLVGNKAERFGLLIMVALCNRADHYIFILFMVALCNRETIYIFILFLLLLLFFPRLISAVGDWMSTILRHVVWS